MSSKDQTGVSSATVDTNSIRERCMIALHNAQVAYLNQSDLFADMEPLRPIISLDELEEQANTANDAEAVRKLIGMGVDAVLEEIMQARALPLDSPLALIPDDYRLRRLEYCGDRVAGFEGHVYVAVIEHVDRVAINDPEQALSVVAMGAGVEGAIRAAVGNIKP